MSQRPSRKTPSPAEPGMVLADAKVKKKKNGITPTIPLQDPEDPDPGAGDEPLDDVNHDEEDKPIAPPQPVSLAVRTYELARVSEGSAIGNSGDWVLIVGGQGFMESETPPVVHVGDSIHLKKTYVNATGTEIYALLTFAESILLQRMSISEIAVQNPGGMNRSPDRWGKLAVIKEEVRQRIINAPTIGFDRDRFVSRRNK